jgi:hypothetical protein
MVSVDKGTLVQSQGYTCAKPRVHLCKAIFVCFKACFGYFLPIPSSEVRKRSFRKTLSVLYSECERCTAPVRSGVAACGHDVRAKTEESTHYFLL